MLSASPLHGLFFPGGIGQGLVARFTWGPLWGVLYGGSFTGSPSRGVLELLEPGTGARRHLQPRLPPHFLLSTCVRLYGNSTIKPATSISLHFLFYIDIITILDHVFCFS